MIRITVRGEPAGEFPFWTWRQGSSYLCRLSNLELRQNGRVWYASATYDGLFLLEDHQSVKILLFLAFGHWVQVSGFGKWPFIHIDEWKDDE